MARDDTVRELPAGRADDAAVFKRTMNIVATGCEYLAAALKRSELDDAINIARRIANLWIDGHAAYCNLVALLGADAPGLTTAHELLSHYQGAVVALLDQMVACGIADRLRAAAVPLRERLVGLVLAAPHASYS